MLLLHYKKYATISGMKNSFEEAVTELTKRHPEYAAGAYEFMRAGLDYAAQQYPKEGDNKHLTAEELYLGACKYALEEYGPLANQVFRFWGIHTSSDFGQIVYNLISVGIFGKQPSDSQSQFDNLPAPQDLLNAPYQPNTSDTQ